MKRTLLLFSFILSFQITAIAQKLEGTWYFLTSDMLGITQMKIETNTFTSTDMKWDFTPTIAPIKNTVLKTIEKNGNFYLILSNKKDTKLQVYVFSNFKEDTSFSYPILDDEHAVFETVQLAEKFIETDTKERFGLICYSEKEMGRIKQLKPLLEISEKEKALFQINVVEKQQIFMNRYMEMDLNFMFAYLYIPNMARNELILMGYNGIVSDAEIGKLIKKN